MSTPDNPSAPAALPDCKPNHSPFWLTLTPLLSVLLTGATLLINTWSNRADQNRSELAKENTEWRAALSRLSTDQKDELASVFQVESFFDNPRYRDDARAIAGSLLCHLHNQYAFDVVLFRMIPSTNATNQGDIVLINRALTQELMEMYQQRFTVSPKTDVVHDQNFMRFLQDPKLFAKDTLSQDEVDHALALTWELDSTSAALATAWRKQGVSPSSPAQDLTNLVLLNQDWTGIDFTATNLQQTAIFGKCVTDDALKTRAIVACHV